MATKTDDSGNRLEVKNCPLHGEFIADAADSECPACQDMDDTDVIE